MKKVIVVLVFFVLQSIAYAQSPIDKGSFTIGGNISYSSQSFDKISNNISAFTFNPQFGYFIVDNFYTALSINYEHTSISSSSSNQLGIGPAVRYYIALEKIKPFLGLGYTYYEQSNGGNNNKLTTSEIKMTGGVAYFVTESFALEASVNYSFLNYNVPNSYYLNDSDQSKLFQIAVGVNYFIY